MSTERQEEVIPTELPKFDEIHSGMDFLPNYQQSFFRELSNQVGQWSRYNFGTQSAHRPALGMIEELNELQMSHDLLQRNDIIDALGDITIYMADYFSILGWDMGEAWAKRRPNQTSSIAGQVSILSRWLAHYHLKGEQNIRGGTDRHAKLMLSTCSEVMWYCLSVANALNVDYLELVSDVWQKVSKRDWRKKKDTAHEVAPEVGVMVANLEGVKRLSVSTVGGANYEVGDDAEDE